MMFKLYSLRLILCAVTGMATVQMVCPSPIWAQVRAVQLAPATRHAAQQEKEKAKSSPPTQVPTGTPQTAQQGQSTDPDQLRLQALLKLRFDRRPTSYLKHWYAESLPSEDEVDSDADSEDDERDDATGQPVSGSAPADPAAAEAAKKQQALIQQMAREAGQFERHVILARWSQVEAFLARLPKDHAKKVYSHMLAALAHPQPDQPSTPEAAQLRQAQQRAANAGIVLHPWLVPDDVLALVELAPDAISKSDLKPLTSMLEQIRARGMSLVPLVERMKQGTRYLGGDSPENRHRAARLLIDSNNADLAVPFLPDRDQAKEQERVDDLMLLVDYYEQLRSRDPKPEHLESSWEIIQDLLAIDGLNNKQRKRVLRQAVRLSTQIRDEWGAAWLEQSFTDQPQRGLEILSNMGIYVAETMVLELQDKDARLAALKLQNAAVEMLLKHSPELAAQWKPTLNILLQNWKYEVDLNLRNFQGAGGQPFMQIDMYGNYYWIDYNTFRQRNLSNANRATPIAALDLLEIRPSEAWQAQMEPGYRRELSAALAKLHLRMGEEQNAFPYIEYVCQSDPKSGRKLVHDFLNTWIRNHDPNTDRRRRNPYIYIYGFEQKAEGIPLTRSKQQRNLEALKEWIARIRQLPIEPVDETLLAQAFTTCHSSAEVYRAESFVQVFGSIDSLKPETIAGIANAMRGNLAGKWRSVKLQEQMKTRRKDPEIQQEVVNGYRAALKIVGDALKTHPDHWRLLLAQACLAFEQNAYENQLQKSSRFTQRRDAAFETFQRAADAYRQIVMTLEENEQTAEVYERWFYASLGATEVAHISDKTTTDPRQYPRIRQALEDLSGTLSEQHRAQFANHLFTRMSPLQPQVKFRYLDAGFAIVGDHPRAREAKQVYDYYRDLITEIQLETAIDGSDRVGQEPFGLFVTLRHTPEIERESGGFDKYVQNQNQMPFAYNYGRPIENYRDKFDEFVRAALNDHFEVLSVIFENPKEMKSRELNDGWRQTPYAYILLKARGPEIDKVPSLKIDLDFLDTSGYAVLPIESPALTVDCRQTRGDSRPATDLQVIQTLDERRADEGKLIVEIKATATGLVPPLEEILVLEADGFKVTDVDDQTVIPVAFDHTADEIRIKSDRSWTVQLEVSQDASPRRSTARQFAFFTPKSDDIKTVFQRYDDADLVEVARLIALERDYDPPKPWTAFLPPVLAGIALLLVIGFGVVWWNRKPAQQESRFTMPDDINPFTVIGLLQRIGQSDRLKPADRQQLDQSIRQIEAFYFDQRNGHTEPDLQAVAQQWLRKA